MPKESTRKTSRFNDIEANRNAWNDILNAHIPLEIHQKMSICKADLAREQPAHALVF